MYTEYRTGGSTPAQWAQNFAGGEGLSRAVTFARFRADPCWEEISRRLPRGAHILDAGCGLGTWVKFLAGQGYRATGLDYSSELVEGLRREEPTLEWIESGVQSMPLADASVDGVISWGVIEHDPQGPEAALREFFRVLRPGGWLFATVPIDSPAHRSSSERQFGMRRAEREFFQYFFDPVEIAERARSVGFDVERSFPCSRHYALALPELYTMVMGTRKVVRAVLDTALGLYAAGRDDTFNMVLIVAQRR